jgi:hypothetical protein
MRKINQLMLISMLMLFAQFAAAQVTTASLSGVVRSEKNDPLRGATVKAVHTPSGVTYTSISREDGRFNIANMRVGGPYEVTITFTGYQAYKIENLTLNVGQTLVLDAGMKTSETALNEVVVKATTNSVFRSNRTGLATNITNEQLRSLPTISRSAADFTRLTPSADGLSFAGRNSQYNNFSLDGAVFNNPFGLDAPTPGGQTDAQPISLDAIEQIQVNIAPYDVSQAGFTGAAVNTVTKSGTNSVKGTAFGVFRNQSLTGNKVSGTKIKVPDLTQFQYGFSLGGPIIKNKLFYFINAEIERREDLGSNFLAAGPGGSDGKNISRVLASDLQMVRTALKNRFQYETGDYENYKHNTNNEKGIIRFDWNVNDKHSISASYNFLNAFKQKPANPAAIFRRGPDLTTLQFRNSGYRINNILHNINLEVKSNFSSRYANKLRIINTWFRDTRDPFSSPFPVVNIFKDGIPYIVAGHEPFSVNNILKQDALQITDNFSVFIGKHTITAGASFERFKFYNSFNLFGYGSPFTVFASPAAFVDSVNNGKFDDEVAVARRNVKPEEWNVARLKLGQAAIYLQDEFEINDNFRLTIGLRIDKPLYFNTADNIVQNKDNITYYNGSGDSVKLNNKKLPKATPLFSPRIGFNYDVKGDKTIQIRGGSGLFTGRFPFVWVGNQVANPNWFFYNVTAPDFKWPQVWRNNIGIDYKTKNNWIATVDIAYTKDLKAMMVRNYGLNKPSGTLNTAFDKRPVYKFDDYALFKPAPGVNIPATSTYVFDNVKVGYQLNVGVQVQKFFSKGWYAMFGYNYLNAKDANSISAEISSDAYDRNPAFGNVNEAIATPSLYGNKHRLVGAAYKKFSYNNNKMATTVSVFMQYAQGGRYTYTYSGDINGDNSGLNDLIYIPTDNDLNAMVFSGNATQQTDQRTGLRNYIAQDKYLNKNRGKYAEKYAILSPWYSNWDIRLLQDFNFKVGKNTNTVQLSADILNAGNLISSKWGLRQLPVNTQPIGVNVSSGSPVYSFDNNLKSTYSNDFSLLSRWQIQFGIRYIF